MTDLQTILNYYEQNLCDREFHYTLTNCLVLKIIFYREAFCHLLGIQHITDNRRYIGRSGYEQIKSGKLTARRLRNINRIGFSNAKPRMEHFMHIGHLMEHGDVFRFYPERSESTRIRASFLIHEENHGLYLHLFLARESLKTNIYAPMSYIVLTERDDNPRLYTTGQEYKKVLTREILTKNRQMDYN